MHLEQQRDVEAICYQLSHEGLVKAVAGHQREAVAIRVGHTTGIAGDAGHPASADVLLAVASIALEHLHFEAGCLGIRPGGLVGLSDGAEDSGAQPITHCALHGHQW